MNRNHDKTPEDALGELVAEGLTDCRARLPAREAARAAFLTGGRQGMRRSVARRVLTPLAVAAGIAAVVLVFGSKPQGQWKVVELTSPGEAHVEGSPAELDSEFHAGLAQTGEGGEIDVQLEERLRLKLLPTSQAALPQGPGRWFGGTRVLRLDEGEVCGTSGGSALGFKLVVETPEARAEILGTTFAVTRNELGTCVCLYRGRVQVVPRTGGGDPLELPPSHKVQVYRDGRDPMIVGLEEREAEMLEAMARTGIDH